MSRNATHRFSGVIGGWERFMGAAAFPRFTNKCKEGGGGENLPDFKGFPFGVKFRTSLSSQDKKKKR